MKRLAIAVLLTLLLEAIFLLGYHAGRADASGSAVSDSAGFPPLTTTGVTSGPELLTAEPEASLGAPPPTAAAQPSAPAASVSGNPATTAPPPAAWTRSGVIAYADESYGPAYLAIPPGPGYLVEICGPGGCVELMSTDAGPDREMLLEGRIADLAVELWEQIAGVDRRYGLTDGTWTVVGRG